MNNFNCLYGDYSPVSPCRSLGQKAECYVRELARELGVSEDLVACGLISVFAGAQVGVSCLVAKNYEVGLSLYLVAGAPPSAGKTPIIERLMGPFYELIRTHVLLSPDEESHRKARIDVLNEGIKKAKKDAARALAQSEREEYVERISTLEKEMRSIELPLSPVMGQMSIASFVKELAARGGNGVWVDAEGGMLSMLQTVAAPQLTSLLRTWSNESIEDITKKAAFRVEKPSLVSLSMWQIKPLYGVFRNKAYRDNGFIARLLPFVQRGQRPRVNSGVAVSPKSERWYTNRLGTLLQRVASCKKYTGNTPLYRLSPEASSILRWFKDELARSQDPEGFFDKFQDIAGKLDVQAIRLAMVLHSMDGEALGDMEIGGETMRRACNLALYFGRESKDIIADADWENTRQGALPLMELVAELQRRSPYSRPDFTVEELCEQSGLSKSKCLQYLHWFCSNRWMVGERMFSDHSGKGKAVIIWKPTKEFSSLC